MLHRKERRWVEIILLGLEKESMGLKLYNLTKKKI